MTTRPFPVLCDRCRAAGLAGEAEFAELADLGDLLDFEAVPRRKRANGWDGEAQRAFIAALAVTGSDRQAAAIVGRAQYGITQLCNAKGNEGFLAARAKAIGIFEEKERVRRSDGLLAAVHGEESRARGRHHLAWSGAATRALPPPGWEPGVELSSQQADELRLGLLRILVDKYLQKLETERRCRLEGRIAEADFCLRQVTMLEVSLDVVSDGDGMAVLKQARLGDDDLLHIAETPLSKLLDEARRLHWQECGDPPRPEYPPRHLLVDRGDYAIEPLEAAWGGLGESFEEQSRRFDEQYRSDAEAQVEWEAKARRDYEERRELDASSSAESRAEPESLRPPGDGTDVTNSVRDGPGAGINPPAPDAARRAAE